MCDIGNITREILSTENPRLFYFDPVTQNCSSVIARECRRYI